MMAIVEIPRAKQHGQRRGGGEEARRRRTSTGGKRGRLSLVDLGMTCANLGKV